MSPLPSFGLVFSCVFWAPGFTYGGESLSYFGTQFVAMSNFFFVFWGHLVASTMFFSKIIKTSEPTLDYNLYPVPKSGPLFSSVF